MDGVCKCTPMWTGADCSSKHRNFIENSNVSPGLWNGKWKFRSILFEISKLCDESKSARNFQRKFHSRSIGCLFCVHNRQLCGQLYQKLSTFKSKLFQFSKLHLQCLFCLFILYSPALAILYELPISISNSPMFHLHHFDESLFQFEFLQLYSRYGTSFSLSIEWVSNE